jgi:hypothetical protein
MQIYDERTNCLSQQVGVQRRISGSDILPAMKQKVGLGGVMLDITNNSPPNSYLQSVIVECSLCNLIDMFSSG